jgi:hypothetical protein
MLDGTKNNLTSKLAKEQNKICSFFMQGMSKTHESKTTYHKQEKRTPSRPDGQNS